MDSRLFLVIYCVRNLSKSFVHNCSEARVFFCLMIVIAFLNFGRREFQTQFLRKKVVRVYLKYNTIQYNSRLLKISKLTKAATAITGYNIAYSYSNQLMFPHRKQSTANT